MCNPSFLYDTKHLFKIFFEGFVTLSYFALLTISAVPCPLRNKVTNGRVKNLSAPLRAVILTKESSAYSIRDSCSGNTYIISYP
jgi:hypothetical protein